MRTRRRLGSVLGVATVFVLMLGGTASAVGPPERETITFSDTFEDEFLSEECGVDVTTSIDGRVTKLTFPDQPVGPQELSSVHFDIVASTGDNQVRFKDVGIDLVSVMPDGTVVLMIVGQVPFDFTGVLMIDLTTGEAILEPHHIVDTTRACHLLTK